MNASATNGTNGAPATKKVVQRETWNGEIRYRGKAVNDPTCRPQVIVIPTTGTKGIEVMLECAVGPMALRRIKFKGWLFNPAKSKEQNAKNMKETVGVLRAMGWRGQQLGDWTGIGDAFVEWSPTCEEKPDGQGKMQKFWQASFVRAVPTLSTTNAATTSDLDELNAMMAGLGERSDAAEPDDLSEAPNSTAPAAGADGDEIPF